MTIYVDIGHKTLFGVILVCYRPLRNDDVINESSRNSLGDSESTHES